MAAGLAAVVPGLFEITFQALFIFLHGLPTLSGFWDGGTGVCTWATALLPSRLRTLASLALFRGVSGAVDRGAFAAGAMPATDFGVVAATAGVAGPLPAI